jgi:hypothetical protein
LDNYAVEEKDDTYQDLMARLSEIVYALVLFWLQITPGIKMVERDNDQHGKCHEGQQHKAIDDTP